MNRRAVLRRLGLGGAVCVAGCTSISSSDNEGGPAVDPDDEEDPAEDPDDEEGSAENSDDEGESAENPDDEEESAENPDDEEGPAENPGPQPPAEATYVVAQDGSGDYESLSTALEVTQSGDVLRLKSGEYTWNPSVNGGGNSFDSFGQRLTFIGDGPARTRLTIDSENVGGNTITAGENQPKFYNLHLITGPDVTFGTVFSGGRRGGIHRSKVTGSVVGDFNAYGTSFNGSVVTSGANLTNCIVNASFRFGGGFAAEETIFNSTVVCGGRGDGTGRFNDCVLNNGVDATQQDLTPMLRNCTVRPMEDNIAFDLKRSGPNSYGIILVIQVDVRRCDIQGRVLNSGGTWIGNRFTTGNGSFDFFFDDPNKIGRHPAYRQDDGNMVLWGNVFDGADVSFGGSDLIMYNEDQALGNYYSEWDGAADEDGDGISDLPRPIPGSSDVVDQYPLTIADREQYGLLEVEE